jgi:hypothetical protein
MKHIWSILCEKSSIDSDTNSISLYNSLESITVDVPNNVRGVINVPINYEIVSFWFSEEPMKKWQGEILIEMYDPSVKKLKEFRMELNNYNKIGKRMRARQKISGISLTTAGDYIFKVKYKENNNKQYETVAEIPLEVIINQQKLLK